MLILFRHSERLDYTNKKNGLKVKDSKKINMILL